MKELSIDKVVDARGDACPLPIVKTRKAMTELAAGQVLKVIATDRGSLNDLRSWTKHTGHALRDIVEQDDQIEFYIQKAGERAQ